MKYEIKYKELTDYLKTLTKGDFQGCWNKNPDAPMKQGYAMDDIEYFKMDRSKITLDTVIDYGMPYLVDCVGNDISLVVLSRRKYKNPNDRLIRARFDRTLIDDCLALYGTPLAGYWVIPEQFITKIK